jgi:hypothetical protein
MDYKIPEREERLGGHSGCIDQIAERLDGGIGIGASTSSLLWRKHDISTLC